MTDLSKISKEELKEEIEKREKEEEEREKPLPLPMIDQDFTQVIKLCESYINDLDKDGWVDEDMDHYIFEAAMEAVYGKSVWEWINKKLR